MVGGPREPALEYRRSVEASEEKRFKIMSSQCTCIVTSVSALSLSEL